MSSKWLAAKMAEKIVLNGKTRSSKCWTPKKDPISNVLDFKTLLTFILRKSYKCDTPCFTYYDQVSVH